MLTWVMAKTAAASLPQVYPSLAQFLFSETASLNKVKLGEWLGDAADENARTLAAFSRAFKEPFFRGASIEEALRAYCAKVKLPTESKKIDRIMEAFAVAFVEESAPSTSSNGGNAVPAAERIKAKRRQKPQPLVRRNRRDSVFLPRTRCTFYLSPA